MLAERLAAAEAEARDTRAAREAAHAVEAEAALARKSAELEAHAEAILAERLAAFEAEARSVQNAREALLAAEVKAADDARADQERLEQTRAVQQALAGELETALADARAALATTPASSPVFDGVGANDTETQDSGAVPREAPWRDASAAAASADVAVVLPIARPTLKLQQSAQPVAGPGTSREASLVELLRSAAAHRASTVYAVVDTRPMMRIEGQINVIGTEAPIAAGDVERFIFEFAPRNLVADAAPEWTCAVPGVGRVRCVTFHDQSGAGLIIHLPAAEVSTAEELGLSPAIQAL